MRAARVPRLGSHFFLDRPAFLYAIAAACLGGLPARISVRMFWLMTFFDLPFFSGTASSYPVECAADQRVTAGRPLDCRKPGSFRCPNSLISHLVVLVDSLFFVEKVVSTTRHGCVDVIVERQSSLAGPIW